jgi:hypothetical protein
MINEVSERPSQGRFQNKISFDKHSSLTDRTHLSTDLLAIVPDQKEFIRGIHTQSWRAQC